MCDDPCAKVYTIFPNPAKDEFTIRAGNEVSNVEILAPIYYPCRFYGKGFTFKLSNLFGQTVREGSLEKPEFNVNLSNLPPSIYYLHISENGNIVNSQQIVVSK